MEETLVACHEGLPESDAWSQGWVRIAMQHAYCHLLREAQLESALVETVLCGGDTDTNAAVVGGLLGAVRGVDAIPARWREAVVGCRSPRPAEYQCGDLLGVADGLFAAGDARPGE